MVKKAIVLCVVYLFLGMGLTSVSASDGGGELTRIKYDAGGFAHVVMPEEVKAYGDRYGMPFTCATWWFSDSGVRNFVWGLQYLYGYGVPRDFMWAEFYLNEASKKSLIEIEKKNILVDRFTRLYVQADLEGKIASRENERSRS